MRFLTIGEFAERPRLSPKALRIYDELHLVVPAQVDPDSGYRLYDVSQVEHARLVGLLRRLDMPLTTIGELLALNREDASSMLAEWWSGVEATMVDRRGLVSYLQSQLKGEELPMRTIELRTIPVRKLVSISRHVTIDETDAFFHDAFARLRAAGSGVEGIAGAPFLIFYGEVSEDSDGPMELCRPVSLDTADDVVGPSSGLQLRVESTHEEAYFRLSRAEATWPAMLPFCDALEKWTREHGRQPFAPLRQVLIADRRSATADCLVCDLSVPLR